MSPTKTKKRGVFFLSLTLSSFIRQHVPLVLIVDWNIQIATNVRWCGATVNNPHINTDTLQFTVLHIHTGQRTSLSHIIETGDIFMLHAHAAHKGHNTNHGNESPSLSRNAALCRAA